MQESKFSPESYSDGLPIWALILRLAVAARLILWVAVGSAATVGIVTLLLPRKYTTSVAFRPHGGGFSSSQLGALATQFGVRMPTGADDESPDFYAMLLESREVLSRISARKYDGAPEDGHRLADILRVRGKSDSIREDKVIQWLREEAIGVSVDPVALVVTVRVRSPFPRLSEEIASAVLEEVDRYNRARRRSQFSAERVFVGERVTAARSALDTAERRLERFLATNRAYEGSAALVFERDRLQREVAIQQQVYTSLVTQLEQARIAEVRSTPVVSVVQPSYEPPRPDRRRLILKVSLAFLFGLSLAVVVIITSTLVAPSSDRELVDRDEALSQLRRQFRSRARN